MNTHRIRTLILFLLPFTPLLLAGLSSCSKRLTYDQWVSQYVSTKVDTTYQTVTLTIPKDSVVIRTRTDTADFFQTVRRGRATVTLSRNRQATTAECECDTATIEKRVMQRTENRQAGVDPQYKIDAEDYKRKAETRMKWIWGLGGFILVAAVVYLFAHWFKLNISRR